MSTLTVTPNCLVCDTAFDVQDDWDKGEIIECTACGQEHEVVERSANGIKIELAPEVEEDWGE
jgi:alpha-aminoadipate carrier protein LysW